MEFGDTSRSLSAFFDVSISCCGDRIKMNSQSTENTATRQLVAGVNGCKIKTSGKRRNLLPRVQTVQASYYSCPVALFSVDCMVVHFYTVPVQQLV